MPVTGIPKVLENIISSVLTSHELSNWNLFSEKDGNLTIKIRFTDKGEGQSSVHDSITPNISYRRKSPKQVKRDSSESEIETDRKCESSSVTEGDFNKNISACYLTKNSGIDQLDSFSEPVLQVHSDLLKEIKKIPQSNLLENMSDNSDADPNGHNTYCLCEECRWNHTQQLLFVNKPPPAKNHGKKMYRVKMPPPPPPAYRFGKHTSV